MYVTIDTVIVNGRQTLAITNDLSMSLNLMGDTISPKAFKQF